MSIYPKLAASRPASIKPNSCFLLMPFAKELKVVHAAVKDVCASLSMSCTRADDIYSQRPIFSSILDGILSNEFIISDLTGKNANVFYETGIAHSLRDPQSVVLIAQSLADVPFDLRHLPIVIYNLENLQRFEIELENRIRYGRSATAGVNFATNYLFPLRYPPHEVKSFIDYANSLSDHFFSNIAACLGEEVGEGDSLDQREIDDLFRVLTVVGEASNGRWRRICDHLRIEVLCSAVVFHSSRERCSAFLKKTVVSQYDIETRDDANFVANLCITLIRRDLMKSRAIHWMLDYLHNPRMGHIDTVRYKIETFIIECDDTELDAPLTAMLGFQSPSVRENAADIIGQKSIRSASKALMAALDVETNPYAARSLITALARQNESTAVPCIISWIERQIPSWWGEPIADTLQKVSINAISKLDPSSTETARLYKVLGALKSSKSEYPSSS